MREKERELLLFFLPDLQFDFLSLKLNGLHFEVNT